MKHFLNHSNKLHSHNKFQFTPNLEACAATVLCKLPYTSLNNSKGKKHPKQLCQMPPVLQVN